MKRILLTGASGTVGKEVLRQICDLSAGVEITVFDLKTRESKSFLKKFHNKTKIVFGDISCKDEISKACNNKDVVIHLAAVIPPLADQNPELAEAVNITGTKNLIDCLEEQSPEAFLLYSSSISVYGDRIQNPWIRVIDQLKPSDRDEYARTKIEAEKIVINCKLRWSIFRLTAIMGVNNHKPSGIMFHMPLKSHLEIATPADTGRAYTNSLNHLDEIERKIFNLSGGEKCRIEYKDFLSRSFKIFGLGKPDFRENSFASRNFHCGYYEDGDVLNEILHFRQDTIDDHFAQLKNSVSPFRKAMTIILRKIIINNLQKQSEPLEAFRTNNSADINHYF